tara:strand:- start:1372 stop:1833 length:462 start_codon:yes stop_codon:yes gene_type:complete
MHEKKHETICFIWRKQILNNYIKKQGLRATTERVKILELIQEMNSHFTIQELFNLLNNKYKISKATIYNNINIFIECKLLVKHSFTNRESLYEKNNFQKGYHLICKCGKISEFSNPKILSLVSNIKKSIKGVNINSFSLNFYGECESCPELKN